MTKICQGVVTGEGQIRCCGQAMGTFHCFMLDCDLRFWVFDLKHFRWSLSIFLRGFLSRSCQGEVTREGQLGGCGQAMGEKGYSISSWMMIQHSSI